MTSIKARLLSTVVQPISTGRNKITVVGVGQVGMACAFTLLTNVRLILPSPIVTFELNQSFEIVY